MKSRIKNSIRKYSPYVLPVTFVASVGVTLSLFWLIFGNNIFEQAHSMYLHTASGSLVKVTNPGRGGGTGFVVHTPKGGKVVITNAHVCRVEVDGKVTLRTKEKEYVQDIIGTYNFHDLCAIVAPDDLPALDAATSEINLADEVYILGFPMLENLTLTHGEYTGDIVIPVVVSVNPAEGECQGYGYSIEFGDLADFAVGVYARCVRTLNSYSTTASILPGNSGSPVFNRWGQVAAVAFAANFGNRGYLVPLIDLKTFLEALDEWI